MARRTRTYIACDVCGVEMADRPAKAVDLCPSCLYRVSADYLVEAGWARSAGQPTRWRDWQLAGHPESSYGDALAYQLARDGVDIAAHDPLPDAPGVPAYYADED